MSKANRRVRRQRRETGALQILEEAFHLVRSADLGAFWIFYLGAVPWSVGLLYFTADMGRSSLAARDAAFAALVLVVLYFWMRFCQAKYCAGLWSRLSPGHLPRRSAAETFRAFAALCFVQAFQVPLLVIGTFFAIPLGWIVAALQNATVLTLTRDLGPRPLRELVETSARYSHDQWAQNHGVLIIFFFVSLFTWVNLVATCFVVPGLMKSFFGVESVFTLSPTAAVMNTTFILGSFLLMQLAIVPLFSAAYVLRCFHSGSRRTGADLLSRLATCREKREVEDLRERGLGRVASIALLAASVLFASPARAEEAKAEGAIRGEPAESIEAERFRSEIAETLEQKKYQWQLSRRLDLTGEEAEQSWLGQRLEEIAASAKRILEAIEKWIEETVKKLLERGMAGPESDRKGESKFFKGLSSTASIALVVIILGLLVWLAASLYLRYRGREKTEVTEEGKGGSIDLESEDIVATQLHEDEWMRLAREQIEKGEERLAIRALFLATLAHLGERGLLKIARFKSNRDYRGELGFRARHSEELRRAFDENTTLFERVWYGLHRLGSGSVEYYLKNHGTISEESARVKPRTSETAGTR